MGTKSLATVMGDRFAAVVLDADSAGLNCCFNAIAQDLTVKGHVVTAHNISSDPGVCIIPFSAPHVHFECTLTCIAPCHKPVELYRNHLIAHAKGILDDPDNYEQQDLDAAENIASKLGPGTNHHVGR
jgi:hypothetical protein